MGKKGGAEKLIKKKGKPKLDASCIKKRKPSIETGTKIGQAPAASPKTWNAWLEWLLQHAGPRIHAATFMTGAFGLRMGEAVTLRAEDINLQAEIPKIRISGETRGNRKSPGDVYIRKRHLKTLQAMVRDGITTWREKGHKHAKGKKKKIWVKQVFRLPKTGYLFKSRQGAKQGHLHYHAVYDHIRREAPKFLKSLQAGGKQWSAEVAKLRPHSGRATLITELMGEGMTTSMSMKYARHAPGSVQVHLSYGRLTLRDVKEACDSLTQKAGGKKWASMSTKQLLNCQSEINAELKRRNASK